MDSDQVYVLLSVFGEKILLFFLGSKVFLSRTQLLRLAKLEGQRLSAFLFLSSFHCFQLIESSH